MRISSFTGVRLCALDRQISDLEAKIERMKEQKDIHIRTGYGPKISRKEIEEREKTLSDLYRKWAWSDVLEKQKKPLFTGEWLCFN